METPKPPNSLGETRQQFSFELPQTNHRYRKRPYPLQSNSDNETYKTEIWNSLVNFPRCQLNLKTQIQSCFETHTEQYFDQVDWKIKLREVLFRQCSAFFVEVTCRMRSIYT